MTVLSESDNFKRLVERGYDRVTHDYVRLEDSTEWPRSRCLKLTGYMLLSIEAGEHEDVIGDWLGVPMFISCFYPETIKSMVTQAGFVILESAIETQQEQGDEIPFLWIFAQKS